MLCKLKEKINITLRGLDSLPRFALVASALRSSRNNIDFFNKLMLPLYSFDEA